MGTRLLRPLLILSVWATVCATALASSDWPQWRGPTRDGHAAADSALPDPLPGNLKLVWKASVGEGYCGPVIVGDRVYMMARQEGNEVYHALDAATGRVIWRTAYEAPVTVHPAAIGAGPGPKATVAVADGRVFGLGLFEVLTGLDAATGRQLWQHRFDRRFDPIWPETGASASPLVLGRLCITQIGTRDKGGVTAFDVETGKEVWQSEGDGPSYTAPRLYRLAGRDQIVTFTQESLVGVDPKSGERLWRVPFKTGYNQNIVDPVVFNDLVIYTGVDEAIRAVSVIEAGGAFEVKEVWRNKGEHSYMNAPVLVGDHIYMLSGKRSGSIVCLAASDGSTKWQGPGRVGDYASIIVSGGRLLVMTDTGDMLVLAADPAGYKELAKWRLADSGTWAHPALCGSRLYIKDHESVLCYTWP